MTDAADDFVIEGIFFDDSNENAKKSSNDGFGNFVEDTSCEIIVPVKDYDGPTCCYETVQNNSNINDSEAQIERYKIERNLQKGKVGQHHSLWQENENPTRSIMKKNYSFPETNKISYDEFDGISNNKKPMKQIPRRSIMKKNLSVPELSQLSQDNGISNINKPMRRNVSFTSLSVREYAVTLGDNPSCSRGPPVSLGWDHHAELDFDVDRFEADREPRRTREQMIMNYRIRKNILMFGAGHTRSELNEAVKEVNLTQQRRRKTIRNLRTSKLEEAMESAVRKIKRAIK